MAVLADAAVVVMAHRRLRGEQLRADLLAAHGAYRRGAHHDEFGHQAPADRDSTAGAGRTDHLPRIAAPVGRDLCRAHGSPPQAASDALKCALEHAWRVRERRLGRVAAFVGSDQDRYGEQPGATQAATTLGYRRPTQRAMLEMGSNEGAQANVFRVVGIKEIERVAAERVLVGTRGGRELVAVLALEHLPPLRRQSLERLVLAHFHRLRRQLLAEHTVDRSGDLRTGALL